MEFGVALQLKYELHVCMCTADPVNVMQVQVSVPQGVNCGIFKVALKLLPGDNTEARALENKWKR